MDKLGIDQLDIYESSQTQIRTLLESLQVMVVTHQVWSKCA